MLSSTFVYCGLMEMMQMKKAADCWIVFMYYNLVALCLVHRTHGHLFIWPSWIKALFAMMTPVWIHIAPFFIIPFFLLFSRWRSVIFTFAHLISVGPLPCLSYLSSAESRFMTICSQFKWLMCVYVYVYVHADACECEWPWPDTKDWMSTPEWH